MVLSKSTFRQRVKMEVLHRAAVIAVLAGAAGSVAFTLYAGRRNPSLILMALFALWVLSPFVALLLANLYSKRWPAHLRAALYILMMVVTVGSLAIYANVALGPARAKTAFAFVVTPPVFWLVIAILVVFAAIVSRRANLRQPGTVSPTDRLPDGRGSDRKIVE